MQSMKNYTKVQQKYEKYEISRLMERRRKKTEKYRYSARNISGKGTERTWKVLKKGSGKIMSVLGKYLESTEKSDM